MSIRVDPQVVELIEVAGQRVGEPRPGEAFRIESPQVDQVGLQDGDVITVETIERGASNGVDLVTSDADVVQTFLALGAAVTWRRTNGLDALTYARLTVATGYAVVEEAAGTWAVRRDADGAVVARNLSKGNADELAVALAFPLDVVVAAITNPSGEPVWTPGPRQWRR